MDFDLKVPTVAITTPSFEFALIKPSLMPFG
jgi:hypothetical protein